MISVTNRGVTLFLFFFIIKNKDEENLYLSKKKEIFYGKEENI
jgi:hypothetical protein